MDAFGTLLDGGSKDILAVLDRLRTERGLGLDHRLMRELWAKSFQEHLKAEPFIPFREIHRKAFQELFHRLRLPENADDYVEEAFERYRRAKVYPEVPSILQDLEGEVPMAIISNADTGLLLEALQNNGLAFNFIITSEEEQSYKPAPSPFRRAIRYLGLPPAHILHVGDSYAQDVVGASSAGMAAALIRRPGEPHDLHGEVNYVVRDLREVRELLHRSWESA